MSTETCEACGGTGRELCVAAGPRGCMICGGSGRIDTSDAVVCIRCDGSGSIATLPPFGENGRARCPRCDGSGRLSLKAANEVIRQARQARPASAEATPLPDCPDCGATGIAPGTSDEYCVRCNGSGVAIDKEVDVEPDGADAERCTACNGTGSHRLCSNDQYAVCIWCRGAGRYETPIAADILVGAADAIDHRATQRDHPNGERSMARTIGAFNALTGHDLSEVDGWTLMALLKFARGQGGRAVLDDYMDAAAYAALAGERAMRGETEHA